MTTRENVERLRADGKSYSEIASALGITKSCVYWHANERNREYARTKRSQNRAQFVIDQKMKAGGKCNRCGYDKCLGALQFHHIDPSSKIRHKTNNGKTLSVTNISRSVSQKHAIEEMNKCELLCANCHAEEHWG